MANTTEGRRRTPPKKGGVIASDRGHQVNLTPEKLQRRFEGRGRKVLSYRYPGNEGSNEVLGEKSPDIPSPNPLLGVTYTLPKSNWLLTRGTVIIEFLWWS
jgi:hypothetical protein